MCYIAIYGFNTLFILQNVLQRHGCNTPKLAYSLGTRDFSRIEQRTPICNSEQESGTFLSPIFHYFMLPSVSYYGVYPSFRVSTCMMRVFKWKRDNLLINIINKIKKNFKCNLNNFSILISLKFISSNRYSSTFKINWRYKIYKPLELNPFRANWYLVLPYANSTILSLGRCLYHNNFSWAFLCAYLYDKGIVFIASLSLHNNIQGSSDFQRWGNCFKELA